MKRPSGLAAFVPRWLLAHLAREKIRPGYSRSLQAVVLYADMVGFARLTEAMSQLGPQGGEVLGQILQTVFGTLAEIVYAFGGDVAWFAGDAVTAFWPLLGEKERRRPLLRAVAATRAVQAAMERFSRVPLPDGERPLAMRVGLACGPVTTMVVGNTRQQRFVLTGPALVQATAVEKRAPPGRIVLHESVRRRAGKEVECDAEGLLLRSRAVVEAPAPAPLPFVPPERLRPYVHPALAARIEGGQGEFLTEFRHGLVPMFVSFVATTPSEIQDYIFQAMAIVESNGGYLSEVEIGDKGNVLVILFGAPLSVGDHSARAAACALGLAALPNTLAIGITSGTLFSGVVGSAGRRQYATPGDEMTLAARLMQVAQGSFAPFAGGAKRETRPPILVSARVCRLAGTRFTYGERQQLPVKGRREPVAFVPLLGRAERWDSWLTPWLGQGDLVGRRAERLQLEAGIARTLGGQGQALTISGEAGVGKSRLAGELLRQWLLRDGVAYVGAALASAQYTPYHAWRDLLGSFFGLRGDPDDVERVRVALEAMDPALLPRLPLLSDVLELGLPDNALTRHFDAQLRQQSTRALLLELIRRRAEEQPLLLVLEDVHWMDQLSWELAVAVGRAIEDQTVMLCLVHRPLGEPLLPVYRAWTILSHHTFMALSELDPQEAVDLACVRLGVPTLPDALSALIQKKAQGHPFFTEELVNALRESGTIRVENSHVTVRGDLEQVHLPDTVQGVVQVRIDRLDEGTRLTLKVASVIGRTFAYRILRDVHPFARNGADLQAHLDLLQQLDITPMERPEPELTYFFKHAITQEVTYATLSFAQRRTLHRGVARWYEAAWGNGREDALTSESRPSLLSHPLSLLVHHYHHAGDQQCERRYARLAGEQAAKRYANQEALTYLGRALELTPRGAQSERFDILLTREAIHHRQGTREAQRRDLRMLEQLADALDDDRRRTQVALRRAHHAEVTGDYDAALAAAEVAVALARATREVPDEAAAFLRSGVAFQKQGEYKGARKCFERALELARAAPSRSIEADSLRSLGTICYRQGMYAEARAYFGEALHIARQIGDRQAEGKSMHNLAAICYRQGDHAEAEAFGRQTLLLVREVGNRRSEGNALHLLGLFASRRRDYVGARAHYAQALRIAREIGDRQGEAMSLNNLGVALRGQGDLGAAIQYHQQSLQRYCEIGDRRGEAAALNNLGQIWDRSGRYDAAQSCLERALAVRREIGHQRGEGLDLANLGLVCHHRGDDVAAQAHARRALRVAQKVGDPETQGYAWTYLGHALAAQNPDEATGAYRQALDLWRELERPNLATEPLAGLARASLAQGDLAGAQRWVAQIMAHLERGTLDGTDEPLRVYLTCFRVLGANADPRADGVLRTAHRLLQERAAGIGDAELRRSFLENVVAHREILQASEG